MLMLVNNETGAVQPITEVAESLSSYRSKTGRRIYLHSDAVQGFGKIPFNPVEAGVDSASFSAHKIGGPRGVGALYVRRGISYDFLYSGGGQERGRRPGTENSAGIFGFALAGEKTVQNLKTELETATRRMKTLISGLQDIEGAVLIPQSRAEGGDFRFSPYILSVAFAPVPGEVLTRVMEEEGFLISTGAACSSKKKNRFRIMENMGISKDLAISAIRISQGRDTRLEDLERFTAVLRQKIPELRKIAG
ncbi:Cysteine desulfurase NifS [subsurface metagenome]